MHSAKYYLALVTMNTYSKCPPHLSPRIPDAPTLWATTLSKHLPEVKCPDPLAVPIRARHTGHSNHWAIDTVASQDQGYLHFFLPEQLLHGLDEAVGESGPGTWTWPWLGGAGRIDRLLLRTRTSLLPGCPVWLPLPRS